MAKSTLHFPFDTVSGTLARDNQHTHYAQNRNGRTILCTLEHRDAEPTPAQTRAMQAFTAARAAATTALADSASREQYAAAFKRQTKYKTLYGYVFAQLYVRPTQP